MQKDKDLMMILDVKVCNTVPYRSFDVSLVWYGTGYRTVHFDVPFGIYIFIIINYIYIYINRYIFFSFPRRRRTRQRRPKKKKKKFLLKNSLGDVARDFGDVARASVMSPEY
ncbi:unnamed protein product [Musa textilis]